MIRFDELSSFAESILRAVNVPEHKASLVATSLVAANLRGVDSHGVQMLPYYVEQLEAGDMSKTADGRVIPCSLFYYLPLSHLRHETRLVLHCPVEASSPCPSSLTVIISAGGRRG